MYCSSLFNENINSYNVALSQVNCTETAQVTGISHYTQLILDYFCASQAVRDFHCTSTHMNNNLKHNNGNYILLWFQTNDNQTLIAQSHYKS